MLLLVVSVLPVVSGALHTVYLVAALLLGAGLIWYSVRLIQDGSKAMSRRMYKYSTFYLALLFMAMIVDVLL